MLGNTFRAWRLRYPSIVCWFLFCNKVQLTSDHILRSAPQSSSAEAWQTDGGTKIPLADALRQGPGFLPGWAGVHLVFHLFWNPSPSFSPRRNHLPPNSRPGSRWASQMATQFVQGTCSKRHWDQKVNVISSLVVMGHSQCSSFDASLRKCIHSACSRNKVWLWSNGHLRRSPSHPSRENWLSDSPSGAHAQFHLGSGTPFPTDIVCRF